MPVRFNTGRRLALISAYRNREQLQRPKPTDCVNGEANCGACTARSRLSLSSVLSDTAKAAADLGTSGYPLNSGKM